MIGRQSHAARARPALHLTPPHPVPVPHPPTCPCLPAPPFPPSLQPLPADSTLLVTGSADKNIKIWGLDFGDCHRSLFAHADSVMAVAFVPNTHYLFTAGERALPEPTSGLSAGLACPPCLPFRKSLKHMLFLHLLHR
jgi:hypothetical protein